MRPLDPTSRQFFEEKYRARSDPWSFEISTYEQQRYAVILEHVGVQHHARAFEPGCSIGVLTEQLADRCDHLIAIDIAQTAVDTARQRCEDRTNVTFQRGALPDDLPAGPFDLIVFSEIGYYLHEQDLGPLARRMGRQLSGGGSLIAAHWTGRSSDHVLAGRRVHRLLDEHLGMNKVAHVEHGSPAAMPEKRAEGFVLDMWTATDTEGAGTR